MTCAFGVTCDVPDVEGCELVKAGKTDRLVGPTGFTEDKGFTGAPDVT